MDYHAVPPPTYQAGGASKREDLCQQDSETVIKVAPDNCKRPEHQAPGDWLRRSGSICDPSQARTLVLLGARVKKYVVE